MISHKFDERAPANLRNACGSQDPKLESIRVLERLGRRVDEHAPQTTYKSPHITTLHRVSIVKF